MVGAASRSECVGHLVTSARNIVSTRQGCQDLDASTGNAGEIRIAIMMAHAAAHVPARRFGQRRRDFAFASLALVS